MGILRSEEVARKRTYRLLEVVTQEVLWHF